MRSLAIILLAGAALLWSSCRMPERAALRKMERLQQKHPGLFADTSSAMVDSIVHIELDTILDTFIIEGEQLDTSVVTALSGVLENLTLENSLLKVELRSKGNIETNTRTWTLSGEVKTDTVIHVRIVTNKQILVKQKRPPPCEVVSRDGAPWWYWLLSVLGTLVVGFLGKRYGEQSAAKKLLSKL